MVFSSHRAHVLSLGGKNGIITRMSLGSLVEEKNSGILCSEAAQEHTEGWGLSGACVFSCFCCWRSQWSHSRLAWEDIGRVPKCEARCSGLRGTHFHSGLWPPGPVRCRSGCGLSCCSIVYSSHTPAANWDIRMAVHWPHWKWAELRKHQDDTYCLDCQSAATYHDHHAANAWAHYKLALLHICG